MFKDPICNMSVDEKIAKYVSENEGVRTYFCSATCKREFEEHEKKDYNKSSNISALAPAVVVNQTAAVIESLY